MFSECSEGSGKSWTPIGTSNASGSAQRVFNGTFDGDGKTINGLFINSEKDAALFLHTGEKAVIKNLNVWGTLVTKGDNAAGICMSNRGTIQGCTFNGSVEGANHLGGICAYNYGTISRCINAGEFVGTGSYIGGICGENRKTIENCYTFMPISGSNMVGGICGFNHSTDTSVKNCYNWDVISGGEYTGGVCGKNDNPNGVSSCYYLDDACAIGNGGYAGGASAISDSALDKQSTFSGWDFNSIWTFEEDYPSLRGVTEPEILNYCFNRGYGTRTSPFEIKNLDKLEAFRDTLNNGTYDYRGKYIKLTADIDMSSKYYASIGKSWTAIGTSAKRFGGNFNGNGHTISGLYQYAKSSSDTLGLFGYNEGGLIEKLTVKGSSVFAPANTTDRAASICRQCSGGTIRECVNECRVISRGNAMAGGICAYLENNAKIERCYNRGSVSSYTAYTGGIVGYNHSGSVKNCYNLGPISSTTGKIGGVCGYVGANSENSYNYNYGTVSFNYTPSGTEGVYGGGDADSVQNCYYNTDAYDVTHATMGKTAEQFKMQETFEGWDFDNVWEMSETYRRPILKAVYEPHKHDLYIEYGNDNPVSFSDNALTSKDGNLYINGKVLEPTVYDNDSGTYIEIELPGGNYYLEEDMELAYNIGVESTVNICLNGHIMNMGENSIVTYKTKGVLSVCDCGENGTITGTHSTDPYFDAKIISYCDFYLYGGKVINTSDNTDPDVKKRAISTYEGTIRIFGGEVVSHNDDAVYITSGDVLYLACAPKISGAADKADVYIDNSGDGAGIIITYPLTAGKPYRVALEVDDIFTYQWTKYMGDARISDYFVSAVEGKGMKIVDDELAIFDYSEVEEPSPSPSAPPLPTATPDPDEDTECIKITAVYSDSGALISVTIEKVMVSEITPEQNTQTRKIFYWESIESMKPIALSD